MAASQTPWEAFETADLNLASFLCCRGFSIRGIKDEGHRAIFVFEHSAQLRRGIIDYANDGAVPARSFCNTLRDLKAVARDSVASESKSFVEENRLRPFSMPD